MLLCILATAVCAVVQLVDAVYVIMAWATATNLANASGNLHIETPGATVRSFISNNIWRAPIAACALGGLMVVLFNLMSCIVLLRFVAVCSCSIPTINSSSSQIVLSRAATVQMQHTPAHSIKSRQGAQGLTTVDNWHQHHSKQLSSHTTAHVLGHGDMQSSNSRRQE